MVRILVNKHPATMLRCRILGVMALCLAVFLVGIVTLIVRQHLAPSATSLPATADTVLNQTTKKVACTYDNAFWAKLLGANALNDRVVFSLMPTATVTVDGRHDDIAWSNSFATIPFNPEASEHSIGPTVRCLWEAGTLFIAVNTVESVAAEKLDKTGYCQIVLATSDPAVRFRFVVDANGVRVGHCLKSDQYHEIPMDNWQAVVKTSPSGISAELALSARSLGIDSFHGGESLPLIVRMGRGVPDKLDSPVTSGYWLLDSLRGFRAKVMLLDDHSSLKEAVRFSNGVLMPGRNAMQWNLSQISIQSGSSLDIPVDLYQNRQVDSDRGSAVPLKAQLVSSAGLVQPLGITSMGSNEVVKHVVWHMRVVVPSQETPGLYVVKLLGSGADGGKEVASWTLWITNDWVTPARQYLLRQRARIEASISDPWHQSISVAHVAKGLAEMESRLGVDLGFLRTMSELEEAFQASTQGKTPRIPTGTSTLIMRGNEDKPVGLTIMVPFHYDESLAWPICMTARYLPNMISVSPAKMVTSPILLTAIDKALNIDADRRYCMGFCALAYEITDLLVRYPEPWAAAALGGRVRWTPLLGNASCVSLLLYYHKAAKNAGKGFASRGEVDPLVSDAGIQWLREQKCLVEQLLLPNSSHHDISDTQLPEYACWLLRHRRRHAPQTVQCLADGYEFTAKHWINIDAIAEQRRLASLNATVQADTIAVQTNGNVVGYTLHLDQAPVPTGTKLVRIIEDGQQIGTVSMDRGRPIFSRQPVEGGENSSLRKRPGMGGQIGVALNSRRFEIVTGSSSTDPKRDGILRTLANRLASAKSLQIEASPAVDANYDEHRLRAANIILIGSPQDNTWLHRMAEKTPIRLDPKGLTIGEKQFLGRNLGIIGVYPNPLNNDRLIVFIASESNQVLEQLVELLQTADSDVFDSDYVVFESAQDGRSLTVLWADQFDWSWKPSPNLHPIATLKQTHPDWQWTQLLGDIVQKQIGTDAFFAHRLLRSSPAKLMGPITTHELYQCFYNDWLVLAHLDTSVFRENLSLAISSFPDAAITGFFNPISGLLQPALGRAEKRSGSIGNQVRLATSISNKNRDDVEFYVDKPHDKKRIGLHLYAQACELTPFYTAECLVDFLRKNPQIDLDALLDRQPRPVSKDKVRMSSVLRGEVIDIR